MPACLPDNIPQRGLSRQQAAAYLGVSLDILRQLSERGDIARVPPGRTVRYDRAALDRWLDRASGLDAAPPTAAPTMTPAKKAWLEAIG
jgi:excisionase family DNA binding protein